MSHRSAKVVAVAAAVVAVVVAVVVTVVAVAAAVVAIVVTVAVQCRRIKFDKPHSHVHNDNGGWW